VTDCPETVSRAPRTRARFWLAALAAQLILLAAEFLAGMTLNLYTRLPASHPGSVRRGSDYFTDLGRAEDWVFAGGPAALRVHVVLGLLIGAVAVALVVAAARAGGRDRAVAAWAGLVLVIGAGFNGGSFLIFGDGDSFASFLMACLFLLAACGYVVALIREARLPPAAAGDQAAGAEGQEGAEPAGTEPAAAGTLNDDTAPD
jgi:hypothetical protein